MTSTATGSRSRIRGTRAAGTPTKTPEPVDARLPAALRDVRGRPIKNCRARRYGIVEESERKTTRPGNVRPVPAGHSNLTELASLGTAVRAATAGDAKSALAFAGSGALLLVDHVHFQYNGLLLGLLVYALFMLRRGDHVKAGALFALARAARSICF